MSCTPEQRVRAMQLHRDLALLDCVAVAEVNEPEVGSRPEWTVEAICERPCVLAAVVQAVADVQGTIHPDPRADEHCRIVARF